MQTQLPYIESLIESGRYPLLTRRLRRSRTARSRPPQARLRPRARTSARWPREDAPRIAHLRRAACLSLAATITPDQGNRRCAPRTLAKPIASRDFWLSPRRRSRRRCRTHHDPAATTSLDDTSAVGKRGLHKQGGDRPAPRRLCVYTTTGLFPDESDRLDDERVYFDAGTILIQLGGMAKLYPGWTGPFRIDSVAGSTSSAALEPGKAEGEASRREPNAARSAERP